MRARRWNPRTAVTVVVALGALLIAGSSAVAAPARTAPAAVPAAPGSASPDDADLSAESRASAQVAAAQGVTLERQVLAELDATGATDFWVGFGEEADLGGAGRIADWGARGRFVYDRLVETARASQLGFVQQLRLLGVDVEPFWIANTVLVRGGDPMVLDAVLASPEVAAIHSDEPVELPEPIEDPGGGSITSVEWGVSDIGADRVWDELDVRGEGIVVGSIDTGVAYTHPALVNQYRGNFGDGNFDHDYNWWDPTSVCPADEPCDNHGHGSHTTGTMVGDDGEGNQIGVAPAAEWIAAKGCEGRTCSPAALLSASEFMLAPTDLAGESPRPELRPHIVNNSWGGAGGRDWYDDTVAAWVAAGMFPVFSNGNNGPGCGTAGAPADGPHAWAVGAHDIAGEVAGFSSRGPGRDEEIRPHISAPGVDVRSSVPGDRYTSLSGTSMAAPHQSGTLALLWAAAPGLVGEIGFTRELLASTATDVDDQICGGTPGNNNVYGEGYLRALGAVEAAPRGPAGVLAGRVTDPAGAPVVAARVKVEVGQSTRGTGTASDGTYRLAGLAVGEHQVTVTRFGYEPSTQPFEVVEDETTTVDFDLETLPTGRIAGAVTDAASGHTVPGARVEIRDVPDDLGATSDGDGGYEVVEVPVGTYEVEVSSVTHASVTRELTVTADTTERADVALDPLGEVEPVSVSSAGIPADESVSTGSMSADGGSVVFYSRAGNLVDDPPETGRGVYLRDRAAGVTELISPTAAPISGGVAVDISADGRYVAFSYRPSDPDGIYLHDRETGAAELVSVNSAGEPANQPARDPAVSADGRYVAFSSTATNLVDADTHGIVQGYLHDRETGVTELVSVNDDGDPAGPDAPPGWASGGAEVAGISDDGRQVLLRGRSFNMITEEPSWDPWEYPEWADFVNFSIAHVFVRDQAAGETRWASRHEPDDRQLTALPGGFPESISGDGGLVGYHSSPPLAAILTRGTDRPQADPELFPCALACSFVYDRATDTAEMLSRAPEDQSTGGFYGSTNTQVSGDGRSVGFFSVGITSVFTPPFDALADATGPFVLDRQGGQPELLVQPHHGSVWDTDVTSRFPQPRQMSQDGRFGLVVGRDGLVPGTASDEDLLFLVDREFDPQAPHARFAYWDLVAEPQRPLSGDPVQVSARVKNVGNAGGEHPVALTIDGELEAVSNVTLEPGESTQVSWTVARDDPGRYLVRIGNVATELEVRDRAPVLDLDRGALGLSLASGQSQTEPLTIGNAGFDRPLEWQLTEDASAAGEPDSPVRPAGAATVPASGPPAPTAGGLDLELARAGPAAASHAGPAADAGTTITHSESLDIIRHVACGAGDGTTSQAHFLRTFHLADFGLAAGFDVTEVTLGVGAASEDVPISVHLYTLDGELRFENLNLIGAANELLTGQAPSLVTVPVEADVPAGSTLVVEVAAPDLLGQGEFRYGFNQAGETAPSYLATNQCGVPEPTPLSEITDEPVHLVMTVTGEPVDLELSDWLEVSPATGTVPSGSSQELAVTVDAAGLAPGEYTANLGIASNDPDTPLTVVPVTVEVTDACPGGFSAEENIVFGDQDSGVPNYERVDGCTFLDLVWRQSPFADHGEFVGTVAALSRQWRDDGLFNRREAQAVLVAAARSDVGRSAPARQPGVHTVM